LTFLVENPITFIIGILALVVAVPMVLWVAGQWIVNIVITPFVMVYRFSGGPWPVFAEMAEITGFYGEFRGRGAGWRGSGELRARVVDEIKFFGYPRSLEAPPSFVGYASVGQPRGSVLARLVKWSTGRTPQR
jgi:hypothetical protein